MFPLIKIFVLSDKLKKRYYMVHLTEETVLKYQYFITRSVTLLIKLKINLAD